MMFDTPTILSTSLLVLGLAACGGTVVSEPPTAAARPSITQILDQMAGRYASAKTYRDEGTIHTSFAGGAAHAYAIDARFRTQWSAPDRLRFEYRAAEDHSKIFVVST